MLEFSEKPLARSSAVASEGGNPDADGHDRSVAGLRGQALRPPGLPGPLPPTATMPTRQLARASYPPGLPPGFGIMREAHA
jgi:hypothetical protein